MNRSWARVWCACARVSLTVWMVCVCCVCTVWVWVWVWVCGRGVGGSVAVQSRVCQLSEQASDTQRDREPADRAEEI